MNYIDASFATDSQILKKKYFLCNAYTKQNVNYENQNTSI